MRAKVLFVVSLLFALINANKPNVLIIIADDMGWNDVSFHGSNEIPTPNLDALAYRGIVLNRFYTMQTCTPSRAALLTGNHPIRTGTQGNPLKCGENYSLPKNMTTMPQHFKNFGYSTYLVGKWHLGHPTRDATPLGKGFDYHYGYWNGYIGYFDKRITQNNIIGYDFHENYKKLDATEYATDLFTSKAKEIIMRHKNKSENPMFMMINHIAPHTGNNDTLEVKNVEENNKIFSYIKDEKRRLYAGLVKSLDESVGEVFKTLEEANMIENTIILFLSDNGAQTVGLLENRGSNWPLKGLKFTLFEGGVRGTAILYYKHLMEKLNNCTNIFNGLAHIIDVLPTLYKMAGGSPTNLGNIDGIDIKDALSGNENANKQLENRTALLNIEEIDGISAILGHGGRYKLAKGSYQNGIYDEHMGSSGRESNNPKYNAELIIKSPVNEVLRKLSNYVLTESYILKKRKDLDLNTDKCSPNSTTKQEKVVHCPGKCLFDLFEDPCEFYDVQKLYPNVVKDLEEKLEEFRKLSVKESPHVMDENSNPNFCNGTWNTWLEVENKCNY